MNPRPAAVRAGARVPAAAVLAIFLAGIAAGTASAHRRRTGARPSAPTAPEVEPQGDCSITLTSSSPSVRSGEPVTLTGTLSCPAAVAVGQQTVTIEQHVPGTPGVTLAGSATTDATGDFSFTTASGLERAGGFWAEALDARSARVRVFVSAAVTLTGPAPAGSRLPLATRRARAEGTATELTFRGTVTPAAPGARVILQRQSHRNPSVWRPIARGQVQADGSYTLQHAFSVSGPATLRVVVRAPGLRATVSETVAYEVAARRFGGPGGQ